MRYMVARSFPNETGLFAFGVKGFEKKEKFR
jgi:hypothetical protein